MEYNYFNNSNYTKLCCRWHKLTTKKGCATPNIFNRMSHRVALYIYCLLLYVHVTVHRNKFLFNKTNRRTNFPNLLCQDTLRAVPLPIIRRFPLYIRHCTCICHAGLMTAFKHAWRIQCRMYSGNLLMMGRRTLRNM